MTQGKLLFGLILVGAVWLMVWVGQGPPAPLASVTSAPAPQVIAAEGKLVALAGQETLVGSAMTARIASLAVKVGDRVEAGQTIAVLDAKDLEARLLQATADWRVAQARYAEAAAGARTQELKLASAELQRSLAEQALAANALERARQLFTQTFVSQAALDEAQRSSTVATARVQVATQQLGLLQSGARVQTLAVLQAQVTQAQAGVDYVRALLDKTRVLSPIRGVVIARYLEVGEVVVPEKPMAVIAAIDQLRVNAEVDETDTARLQVGDGVDLTAYAYPGRVFKGQVEEIADHVGKRELKPNNPAVNLGLKIIQVKIGLLEPTPLRLGMTVDVRIMAGTPARLVSRQAVSP